MMVRKRTRSFLLGSIVSLEYVLLMEFNSSVEFPLKLWELLIRYLERFKKGFKNRLITVYCKYCFRF